MRIHPLKLPLLLLFCLQSAPSPAWSCPFCHSNTATEVRAGLLETALDGITIPALVLPFVTLAIVICAIQIDWDELFDSGSALRMQIDQPESEEP